jgi:N-methylhydantoinase B/oxoprolinase/acetone carboxylase alpha subunit
VASPVHEFRDRLDYGTPVCVALGISGDRMTVDVAGTGPAVPGNSNAPRAVVQDAVIYVLRTLAAGDRLCPETPGGGGFGRRDRAPGPCKRLRPLLFSAAAGA